MAAKHFNVRVYGVLIENGKVLVCDELIKGHEITKFPGGGLEHGEGTIDCLKREFVEETGHAVEVTEHFYTTDFYQKSAYNPNHQIISIYYIVKPLEGFTVKSTDKVFDFVNKTDYAQTFRWVDVKTISGEDFTLPIDKKVGELIKERFS
ncbi:MAG: hydrolase [Bacteroidetes bacterium]|nr:hydrolase [Bacteroidota bacterium]